MAGGDGVGEFDLVAAFDRGVFDSAVADEVVARAIAEDPEAEAVQLPVVGGASEERAGLIFGEGCAVGGQRRHHARVGVEAAEVGEIGGGGGGADEASGVELAHCELDAQRQNLESRANKCAL